MAEIAAQLLASPSGLTRLADRLVGQGLIDRDIPHDNRRVVRIRLTALGRTALAAADRVFREALGTSFAAPSAMRRWERCASFCASCLNTTALGRRTGATPPSRSRLTQRQRVHATR